jgi:hypothetical protein
VKNNPGSGSRLPVFITREYTDNLKDFIDIWAGDPLIDLEVLPKLQMQKRDHWFYNGARPNYGSVILDTEAIDMRLNCWLKYIFRLNVWFIWHGTNWRHCNEGPKAGLFQRVFTEPLSFINWPGSYGNGDGIVFYPGRSPFFPEEDRGLDQLIGSIRLKNIRRGQQDYEIMWLAEQAVAREKVIEIVRPVVPRAFSEVGSNEPVPWSQNGEDYDFVRSQLLSLIDKADLLLLEERLTCPPK